MDKRPNVLVLLSGGIDSTACLEYYASQNCAVSGLFVDYGQLAAKHENKASLSVSRHYDIPLEKVALSCGRDWKKGYIMGRNAFLLYTALMNFKYQNGLIAIGVHSGTDYWDCSEEFIQQIKVGFESYSDGCISIDAPFLKWNKNEIWEFCIRKKVPLEQTYSCELGKTQPCGQCLSCKDLEALYAKRPSSKQDN